MRGWQAPKDWVCPMDPDVRADKPGVCPRCGMKLVLRTPDRVEYPLEVSQSPELLLPGAKATLTLKVFDPARTGIVKHFDILHEKLMHLFLVSENLQFFAHQHPVLQADGTFRLEVELPYAGMYRLLADYYPSGAAQQLAVATVYVTGASPPGHVDVALEPSKSENLTASLRLEPEQLLTGLESKLTFRLEPPEGLEPYLGAWGHMLAASEDLIDLLHVHPFLTSAAGIQFNVIFPRAGLYRVWAQFQRLGVVNTVVFTVPVREL